LGPKLGKEWELFKKLENIWIIFRNLGKISGKIFLILEFLKNFEFSFLKS